MWMCNVCGQLYEGENDAALCHPDIKFVETEMSDTERLKIWKEGKPITDANGKPLDSGRAYKVTRRGYELQGRR